jgi:hypothetical protein
VRGTRVGAACRGAAPPAPPPLFSDHRLLLPPDAKEVDRGAAAVDAGGAGGFVSAPDGCPCGRVGPEGVPCEGCATGLASGLSGVHKCPCGGGGGGGWCQGCPRGMTALRGRGAGAGGSGSGWAGLGRDPGSESAGIAPAPATKKRPAVRGEAPSTRASGHCEEPEAVEGASPVKRVRGTSPVTVRVNLHLPRCRLSTGSLN